MTHNQSQPSSVSPHGHDGQSEGLLESNRFVILFAVLLLFFLLVPIVEHLQGHWDSEIPQFLEVGGFVVLLFAALGSIHRHGRWKLIILTLGIAASILWVLPIGGESTEFRAVRHLLAMLFFACVIISIFAVIFATRRVTLNLLSASLCVYLLFGIVWALGFSMISALNPGAFTASAPMPMDSYELGMDSGRSAEALYFSFSTLTTVGFGDIVAVSHSARMLTVLEAVVGQLYLAVMVARLVGLHIVSAGTDTKA